MTIPAGRDNFGEKQLLKKTVAILALACFLLLCAGGWGLAARPPDYANPDNWLSAPTNADKAVDVFFLYPSAWTPPAGDSRTYADIDDTQMRSRAGEILAKTAGLFDRVANIYAPYYRQADAGATLGMPLEDVEALTRAGPGEDALAAFTYYLEHYNDGRPFILASHSQGSSTMKVSILKEMIARNPELRSRMIAAYCIGWTFTPDYLTAHGLQFAKGADDTGVIISWNTEAPGVSAVNPVVYPGALVINPIIWTTANSYAPASKSLGSSIAGHQASDGRIDPGRGVIINTSLNPAKYDLSPMFPYGSLHAVEWELYFHDVLQNVITRSVAYYSPKYAQYAAALGSGELGDFARCLRQRLEQKPTPEKAPPHPAYAIFFKLAAQPDAASFKTEAEKAYGSQLTQSLCQ
ncbi:DUF3089 domain-containing protein [Desulfovibrio sp. OttesenSCG-928-G11]|nr:DUF3089 domain-containing protein [Desulfovibrio sp. OttesenSCG-928-G11]